MEDNFSIGGGKESLGSSAGTESSRIFRSYSVHSDVLVHWTGKDIDPSDWWKKSKPDDDPVIEQKYLERLKNILSHGLWMTNQKFDVKLDGAIGPLSVQDVPCLCFTELKLSESRVHAIRYGRLGIGVKRGFLFERGGRPVVYFGHPYGYGNEKSATRNDVFLQSCAKDLDDKSLMHFFKPMSTKKLDYDLYSESEWRIVYHKALMESEPPKVTDPSARGDGVRAKYLDALSSTERDKLKYLVPLDRWLAIIIYPSVSIKSKAQDDEDIPGLIADLKNKVEKGNLAVELDLDLCMNL